MEKMRALFFWVAVTFAGLLLVDADRSAAIGKSYWHVPLYLALLLLVPVGLMFRRRLLTRRAAALRNRRKSEVLYEIKYQ